jgi:hypothetical protein
MPEASNCLSNTVAVGTDSIVNFGRGVIRRESVVSLFISGWKTAGSECMWFEARVVVRAFGKNEEL